MHELPENVSEDKEVKLSFEKPSWTSPFLPRVQINSFQSTEVSCNLTKSHAHVHQSVDRRTDFVRFDQIHTGSRRRLISPTGWHHPLFRDFYTGRDDCKLNVLLSYLYFYPPQIFDKAMFLSYQRPQNVAAGNG